MLPNLRIRTAVLFAVLVVFVGIFAAEHWGIYNRIASFDKIMHVAGGIAAAWIGMALLQKDIVKEDWWAQMLVLIATACLIGVFWEFAEFAATSLHYTHPGIYHYFHGGDLADTLGDLAADIGGGLLFSLWALYRERF